ncbi:putative N-acetylmannosaminyltransferase [Oxobacter pfennigii]|uniref:Putative N-acetylmannosaminyltransferase n=1 Tax=Oxobacter pfennigii TaxID=36849 RepID=A0A0P8WC88_9CLOT|nr:WecB/TagA/CpsF family glycosyltransferase [Oxobacter pfennigii]KPU46383.1 putative N-acetylmannosaminyltransferase [Oxobacter pfennigii]
MVNILGFDIYNCSKNEYVDELMKRLSRGERAIIISGNPEVLYNAKSNSDVLGLCNEADIIPDGIGVLIAAKLTGQKITEKIAGIDVMEDIMKASEKHGMSFYFLGAEDWVVKKAAKLSSEKYNVNVKGFHNGYFDINNCQYIIDDINKSGSNVLLAAMGAPRQEIFISKYKNALNCSLLMGVGGSFDVLAGKVNRAPQWMIKLGLEWLYRVSCEPWRIKRLISIPKFLLRVLFSQK